MLNITLDLDTGLAKLASATTIKAGADVPVTINTVRGAAPSSPGASPAFELGICTDAAPPVLKAYLDEFDAENDHTFTGVLDANDERLVAFMAGKATANCQCEVAWTVAGQLEVAPNFAVPVQSRGIPSDPNSQSGPHYYTETEVDALLAVLAARGAQVALVAATGNLTLSGTQTIDGVAVIAGDVVFAKSQTTAADRKRYAVAAGAWTAIDQPRAVVVQKGTVNAGLIFVLSAANTYAGITAADVDPAGTDIAAALGGKLDTTAQAADVDPAGTDIAAALGGKLPLAGGTMDENAIVTLFNGSKWQQSTPDKGIAGTAGFSVICSAGYEYKFALGFLFILSDGSSTVRKVLYAPAAPTATDDTTLGFTTDTTWEMADGTLYECTDATATAAVWAVVPATDATKLPLSGGEMTGAITNDGVINVNIGNGNTSSGTDATAVGKNNTASGNQASAVGYTNTASASSSAFGYSNTASAGSSAVGYTNTASGNQASAVGYQNDASGNQSSAVGYYNTASAGSSAVGYQNTASAGSSAFGYSNTASGNRSSAVGYYNTASGNRSSAFGNGNTSSGNRSSAFGYTNTASGYYFSSAFGYSNTASGNRSSAVGYTNTASGNRSSAVGYLNTASGDYSSAVGFINTASGTNSSAVGYTNTASGNQASAVGFINTASGTNSSAVGYSNTASGNYSSAVGFINTAYGTNSSAVGYSNTASGTFSSAFGYRVTTTVANTQEFGFWSDSSTRAGAVRVHGTRMVALTLQDRATEYDDGGSTAGSEADDTLMREAYSIRRDGDTIILDVNIGGTVKTVVLGVAA